MRNVEKEQQGEHFSEEREEKGKEMDVEKKRREREAGRTF